MLENSQCQEDFINEGALTPTLKLLLSENIGLKIRSTKISFDFCSSTNSYFQIYYLIIKRYIFLFLFYYY